MFQNGFSKIWILVIGIVILVAGALVWQQLRMPADQEHVPGKETEASQEELPTDETANWETYQNEQHGYKIKYPKSWYMEESTVAVTVIRPWQRKEGEYDDPQRELEIRVLPGGGVEGSYQLRWYANEISLGRAEDKENTIIGSNYVGRTICFLADPNYGYPAGECHYRVILLEHNKNLYEFMFFEKWSEIDVARKTLSTFRFLE